MNNDSSSKKSSGRRSNLRKSSDFGTLHLVHPPQQQLAMRKHIQHGKYEKYGKRSHLLLHERLLIL